MPKVKINGKGVVQSKGSGFEIAAKTTVKGGKSISGNHSEVRALDGATTLTADDSGKTFICGGTAGTLQFPVTKAGWHGTFFITGAIAGDVVISGSSASSSTSVNMISTVVSGSAGGTTSGILFTSPKDIRFDESGGEGAGDRIDVTVLVANALIAANGVN